MNEIDLIFNQFPVCPYCGIEDHDWWDGLSINVVDGSEWSSNCSHCGQDYKVIASVDTSFSTGKE